MSINVMNKLLNWDSSINIGDYVISTYGKSTFLYQVVKITKRFITKNDVNLYSNVDKNAKIGDEYNPIVTNKPVGNLNIISNSKFKKQESSLDGSYLIKVNKSNVQEWIDKLTQTLSVVK